MQITVNERIKKIAEKLYGDNISAMAAALCVKRSTLQDIVAGKQSKPGYEIIRQIAEISSPKISLDWLILGVGNMFASEKMARL